MKDLTTEDTEDTERATPETDGAERMAFAQEYMVPTDFARKLERERDEARILNIGLELKWKLSVEMTQKAEAERDLARLSSMESDQTHDRMVGELERVYKERDEARNKMADALQELDLRSLDYERMKQERDEAREAAAAWENKWKCAIELAANYSLEREHNAMKALEYKAERDRARLNLYEEAAK